MRPKRWVLTAILGIVFGRALKFFLKAIVMPLMGADPINRTYHCLARNSAALVAKRDERLANPCFDVVAGRVERRDLRQVEVEDEPMMGGSVGRQVGNECFL